jgi:hypothetical protein
MVGNAAAGTGVALPHDIGGVRVPSRQAASEPWGTDGE